MPEAIIETAIGLFFVFMITSIASSQLVEWLASYRHWRANELEKTIRAMLYDPQIKGKIDSDALILADKLYAHPLIASLAPAGKKPSYIPASKFTLALFDVILSAGTETSSLGRARLGLEQVKNHLLTSLPSSAGPDLLSLLNQIQALVDEARAAGHDDEAIAAFALPPRLNNELKGFLQSYGIPEQAFNTLIQSMTPSGDLQLAQIRTGVAQLARVRPELSQLITSLFNSLDTYVENAEPQLAAARRNLEKWFDDVMERAGGGYKRRTQLWLGIVGLIVALLLNVDAVSIATTLWRDPTLRANVVQQAQKYQLSETSDGAAISSPSEAAQAIRDLNTQLGQDLRLPIGWGAQPHALQAGESCTLLPLRSGDIWGVPGAAGCMQLTDAAPNPNGGLVGKLTGFIIIALAVSQGAPFWFDLLSKLTNLRGTGPAPVTSRQKTEK